MPTEPTTPHEATRKGVADAWDFWFSQHPVSVPELIHEAVTASVREWLDRHGSSLLATPGAPPAELTEAQRLAEQIIRIRAKESDGNVSAAVSALNLPSGEFFAKRAEVTRLITEATVTVSWPEPADTPERDGGQAEGGL